MSFNFTEIEPGEKVVFGPVTTTKTTSISGSDGLAQSSMSRTSGRTVGITDRQVIVEDLSSPDKTQIIANADVQRVFVKRKQRGGQTTLTLVRVATASGQTVKLDMKGLPGQAEDTLKEIFPGAEIAQGGSTALLIIAIVIGVVVFFMCVLPMIIGIFAKIFGS